MTDVRPSRHVGTRRRRHSGAALGAKEELILDAVLAVLGRDGIAGVSMRAIAREAGVSVGLATYYFPDKNAMIAAALDRLGAEDAQLLDIDPAADPVTRLLRALQRVADPDLLSSNHLALRLQLWSLAPVDPAYASINTRAQTAYRDRIADLVLGARPTLSRAEAIRRAGDIVIVQNGVWLTSLLIPDPDATERAVRRCEQIALAGD